MSRRPVLVAALCAAVVVLGGGYVAADAYDLVPGPLTVEPAPSPHPPFPTLQPPSLTTEPVVPTSVPDTIPDPATLAAELAPLTTDPRLGPDVSVLVRDLSTGQTLYDLNSTAARTPASTTKLFTAVAAMETLGPEHTLDTRVVQGSDPSNLYLVGGGDMMLAAGAGDPTATNGHAGLGDLAAAVKAKLDAAGITHVSVTLDDSLFTGPAISPTVDAADVTSGQVAPIAPLAVNIAKVNGDKIAPRQTDPAMSAAQTFVQQLKDRGVSVSTTIGRGAAPSDATPVASVSSAPLRDIAHYFLTESDNTIAEVMGRLVAAQQGKPASFEGATAAVVAVDAGLGVDTKGVHLSDCSGLSNGTEVTALALTDLVRLAASGDHPELVPVIDGLPIAGLTGTLSDRYDGAPAAGYIRAKTGTLATVATLAGVAVDADGRPLVFAIMANGFPRGASTGARIAIDSIASAIQGCGCRS